MSEKFNVEIISPDRSILKTETSEVIIPSYEGEMGILKDHIPLITFLRPGILRLIDDKDRRFFVAEGTVEFSNNILLILSATIQNLKDIKTEQVKTMISETEKKLLTSQLSDKQKYVLNHRIDTLKQIN